ncbi:MAG: HAD hydrolase-like protein, partial [Spirochaetales bacterium]|nr:HAD hydrolase-like protein [Spirochaetales bacterium]
VELLCEQEKLPAERFLMIGDTYESDIRMADKVGCKSILIDKTSSYKNYNSVKDILEITRLF